MSSILSSVSSENFCNPKSCKPSRVKKDSIIDILDESGTGFSEHADLHFKTRCKTPKLITPLYQENYLSEFKTEEEKAAARRALGIYNKGDVVAMSLLTTENTLPTSDDWKQSSIKQLKQGDVFFTPITTIKAVYDTDGKTLDFKLNEINTTLTQQQKQLISITQISKTKEISSLGDIKVFLQGFNNGDNLYDKLDEINQEMLRFEKTGQIS